MTDAWRVMQLSQARHDIVTTDGVAADAKQYQSQLLIAIACHGLGERRAGGGRMHTW